MALVAYWSFDEGSGNKTYDKSDYGFIGTLTNMDTANCWVDGVSGKCLKFDGNNDYLDLPYNFSKPNTLTISLWFKTTASTRGIIFFQANMAPLNTPVYFVPTITIQADGKIRAEYWTGSPGAIISYNSLNDGNWHHVGFVGNTNNQILYIDGVSNGTRAGTINNDWWTNSAIATGYDDSPRGGSDTWTYFNGSIDELSVYNHALSQQEIDNLYRSTPSSCNAINFGINF